MRQATTWRLGDWLATQAIMLILGTGGDVMASCTCITADAGVISDPSCRAHEGTPAVGDHRGDPPPFKQMIKQAVAPPAELTGVQRVSWYAGVFLAILIVMIVVGALVGLVLGLINWIFL